MPTADLPGLLLVNLGTPAAPRTADVRAYLREFLSDPSVLDMPAPLRWLLLNGVILPFRSPRSAEAYAKVWTNRGSPLLVHGRDLAEKVQRRLAGRAVVELAMRYGEPSIAAALEGFHRRGVSRIVVFPLYPQLSSAATGSSIAAVRSVAARVDRGIDLAFVPAFFDDPRYIACFVANASPVIAEARPEVVFFSFHGLPERQIRKSDPSGRHCLSAADCCYDPPSEVLAACYRAQCFATARLLATRLGIPETARIVSFQSRLGRTPWIRPFTDIEVREAARRGVKRAVIVVPSFVADCLETLEEIGIRAVADWWANGGKILRLVPAPNADDAWADAVVAIAADASPWLR